MARLLFHPAPGGSTFRSAVQALNPIRWYKLNDVSSGGVAADSGSQGINGTYPSPAHATATSLLPFVKGEKSLDGSGGGTVGFANTGLPTGNVHFTIGQIFQPTFMNPAVVTLSDFNGVGFLFGTNQFQFYWPGGDLGQSAVPTFSLPALFIGTYDGTTINFYIDGALAEQTTGSISLAAAGCFVGAAQAGALVADSFMLNGSISAAVVASLWTALEGH